MNQNKNQIKSNQVRSPRGGARAGAGRPPGSIQKVSWRQLIDQFETAMGHSVAVTIVENYIAARTRGDWTIVARYDGLILNKLAPDLFQVEVTQNRVAEAEAQFRAAMTALSGRRDK